ncbi:putative receptor-like protein kinase At5g20050 [Curcuma longa]|uniref:putative receptor-like protein kinase At5g20050 n=1 Tax=Curcuma longa TaxID=136217 RepID=UPI003D9DEE1C
MEARRAKAVAAATILSLLVLLLVLWFCLGATVAFFVVLAVSFVAVVGVLAWVLSLYTDLSHRQLSLARRSVADREEHRVEYSFLRKVAGLPIKFRIESLTVATDGFRCLLGRGSSASVFRGILDDGTAVAVKRIDEIAERGDREFRTEVAAIASIHHRNLVRLLGYCVTPGPRFLVYEFVANGSLDRWIFPSRDAAAAGRCLPWPMRHRVAIDVAKALSYLHHDCRARVLHLDVKPENILLDEGFRALVADFGLSKLMGKDESRVVTTVRGTRGYLAPEWLIGTGVSVKSDIYSYGMVLLEIVGGRRAVQLTKEKRWSYFPKIVHEKARQGKALEVLDERLNREGASPPEAELRTLVHVALWCIRDKAEERPSMARVVDMLEGRIDVDEPPPQSEMLIYNILEHSVLDEEATDDRRAAAAGLLDLGPPSSTAASFDVSLTGR